ncbi:ATP-binding cassette domain-containing protein [Pseudoduganella sp. FT25W]|jgi:ABC-2 type transport system ATP-binding protein|uniref:ATP-binding cassette domain-containing protein n=1 Tax=Duganella alba TaxID=2666081 RepID=A0A6L5QI29_9BURK|nr:ATP-binding cassette domain-containing protein [Duganella alba]MRX09305.1 ATP-binding cassette domain-containing protein [Duganella alba]MRX17173.1 ATP-binding cassette domain-containing protein [Duganella alba]
MELRIEQLTFEYASHPLFRQFSLRLGAGVTWLRGENGAGKTTLLKLAGGALTPHAGTVWIDDIELHAQPLAYRLHCYYCGGDTPQLPWLTVREVLDLHVSLYPGADAALLNAELAAFHLLPTLDQPVTTLSLGQHKKMQLSLALALPVRLLLIDEPFNGLDVDAVAYLRQQLSAPERLARQCILLTSHLEPALPLNGTVQL